MPRRIFTPSPRTRIVSVTSMEPSLDSSITEENCSIASSAKAAAVSHRLASAMQMSRIAVFMAVQVPGRSELDLRHLPVGGILDLEILGLVELEVIGDEV